MFKVVISNLRITEQLLKYDLEKNPLHMLQKSKKERMHSLPLLPFAVLILVQTNPTEGLFWRPAT